MTESTVEATVADTPQYESYWGVSETHKHFLPDGKQFFVFKIMDEGAKSIFQKLTNQDVVIDRSQQARVKTDPVAERHTLIKTSVTDWNLWAPDKDGVMAPSAFSKQLLEKWLQVAPPKVVEDLEFAIRKANPWMQAEMTVEEIDKEVDRLLDLRKQVAEREAGEGDSASK